MSNKDKPYLYGNCYYASEALYHILGGKEAGWTPFHVKVQIRKGVKIQHWFLTHNTGVILDPSKNQFGPDIHIPWEQAKEGKFQTKKPSEASKKVMAVLTWDQELDNIVEGSQW